MKSRILICGGRAFNDHKMFNDAMLCAKPWFDKNYCIINGFAKGADMMAHVWAFFEGRPSICMPANWSYYGNKAGAIRNTWMLDFTFPDLVIAFPGGDGTANMIEQSRDRNIEVWEVK